MDLRSRTRLPRFVYYRSIIMNFCCAYIWTCHRNYITVGKNVNNLFVSMKLQTADTVNYLLMIANAAESFASLFADFGAYRKGHVDSTLYSLSILIFNTNTCRMNWNAMLLLFRRLHFFRGIMKWYWWRTKWLYQQICYIHDS